MNTRETAYITAVVDAVTAAAHSEHDLGSWIAAPTEILREALHWSYSTRVRDDAEPPAHLAAAVRWRGRCWPGSARPRKEPASANSANRKRMVRGNAIEYACETGVLPVNPLRAVKWTKPHTLTTVDPRVVINPE